MSTSVWLSVTVDFQSWVVEVSSFSSSKNLPPLFKSLLCLPSPICSLDASFRWSGVGLWSPPASAGFGHGARASSSPSSITIFHIQTMQLPHHGGGVRVQGDLGLGGAVSLHLGGQSSPRFLTWYCSYRSLARIQQEDFSLLLPDQRRLKLLSSG